MAQWINILRNSSFVNPSRLPFLCEKTGAIALAQPGLAAGRLAVQQTKCCYINGFLKLYTGRNIGRKFISVQKSAV